MCVYLDSVEREYLSVLVCEREGMCVCVRRHFCSQRIMNIRNKKPKENQKQKKIQMNVVYLMQTCANVRICPPNWTYTNIRNYGLQYE